MDAAVFYDSLKKELGCKSDSDLARVLEVNQASISQDKKNGISEGVLAKRMKSALDASAKKRIADGIEAVVEFYPVEIPATGKKSPIDQTSNVGKEIVDKIKGKRGIYSFYNSEAEIIYIGKSNKCLWTEMKQTFNREFTSYKRYVVRHPSEKPRTGSLEQERQISNQKAYIYDTSTYFSVYICDYVLVDTLESIMIQIAANDLINTRMEKGILRSS